MMIANDRTKLSRCEWPVLFGLSVQNDLIIADKLSVIIL